MNLKEEIRKGIPSKIPSMPNFLPGVSRAPKRKKILNANEKKLAIRNALRYFPSSFHSELSKEFLTELEEYGRIFEEKIFWLGILVTEWESRTYKIFENESFVENTCK